MKILSAATLILIFASCDILPSGRSSGPQYVKFEFRPAAETQYTVNIHTAIHSETEFNGQKIRNVSKSDVGLRYHITVDSLENTRVRMTYNQLAVYLKKRDSEQFINTANGSTSFDPLESILHPIIGSALTATFNKKGDLIALEGDKVITDKVMAGISEYPVDAASRKTIEEQLSQLVGENFVKNNIEQSLSFLKKSAVAVGESWYDTTVQTADVAFNTITKFTLDEVSSDGVAEIRLQSRLKSIAPTVSNGLPSEATPNLSGEQSGWLKVDTRSGMVLASETKAEIEGTVEVMLSEVPVKIGLTRKIDSRKL